MLTSVASDDVERVLAQRVSLGQMQGPAGGGTCQRKRLRAQCMEATMRFLDSTSAVMLLIMAGVFAPITIIHILATSVFQ